MQNASDAYSRIERLLRILDCKEGSTSSELAEYKNRLNFVVEDLGVESGLMWVIELEQDAAFFASVVDSGRREKSVSERLYPFSIRFSLWGGLVALVSQVSILGESRDTVQDVVERHGFVFVPSEVLARPYDGDDPMFHDVGEGRWFDRYFEYY